MPDVKTSAVDAALRQAGIDDATRSTVMTEVRDAAAPLPDTWIYRIVVAALGVAIFVPLFGMIGRPETDAALRIGQLLLPIATGALGALAGLLAPSPAARS